MQLAGLVDPNSVKIDGAGKLEKGQTAVGVMSDDLKRLYSLHCGAVDKANNLLNKLRENGAAHRELHEKGTVCGEGCRKYLGEQRRLSKEHDLAVAEHEALKEIFWASVRIEFPELLDKSSLGIAEDFTIYYVPGGKEGIEAELQGLGPIGEMLSEILLGGRMRR